MIVAIIVCLATHLSISLPSIERNARSQVGWGRHGAWRANTSLTHFICDSNILSTHL